MSVSVPLWSWLVPVALTATSILVPNEDKLAPPASSAANAAPAEVDPHIAVLNEFYAQGGLSPGEQRFPSARLCGSCHKAIYEEWSTSQHAYASISPMFHKFEQALNTLASGTVGSFCLRCHASVGTTLGEERHVPIYERDPVSLEGVTCVTCHRVNQNFMKVNGERSLVEGALTERVFGPSEPLKDADGLTAFERAKRDFNIPGDQVHAQPAQNEQLKRSEFCMSCHQVAVHPGIKLEVVWDQYKDSPAVREGITCQECHMGKVIGEKAEGDNWMRAPGVEIAGEPGAVKKHTDHSFIGPGYSIAHPGVFPHNHSQENYFSVAQWMAFDWREWTKPDFESRVAKGEVDGSVFKSSLTYSDGRSEAIDWSSREDRDNARKVIATNQARMQQRNEKRRHLMESGSHLDGPFFESPRLAGEELSFHYVVKNISKGHNMPSGSLGAQPEIWLNVALLVEDGPDQWRRVWESGYLDKYGDMADNHSQEVHEGTLEADQQLFNLQSKFLTTNLKGTDREMYLPVPFDGDQLPFIRPAGTPNSVLNHPPFIRMEQRSIPPLSERKAHYSVPSELLSKAGKYRLAVRLRSRAEPMYFMGVVGATEEMKRLMNEQMIDIHPYTVEFELR
ncbi:MAG: cytochrome C [Planctomycetes bacterium]|nr:cytochrome C [Planctomycetota bacterium]